MLHSEALAHLPADAYAVSVARDAVYVGCRDGSVVLVPRPHGTVSKLAAACKGGNIVADGADVFVLDVRGRTIVREYASSVTTLASVRFSGVGVLDDAHL